MTTRCVVCKSFVMQKDLQYHDHKIIAVSKERSESPAVEVIDIDEGQIKPNKEVQDGLSIELVSVDEDIPAQSATEEIVEKASVMVEESKTYTGFVDEHVLESRSSHEIES